MNGMGRPARTWPGGVRLWQRVTEGQQGGSLSHKLPAPFAQHLPPPPQGLRQAVQQAAQQLPWTLLWPSAGLSALQVPPPPPQGLQQAAALAFAFGRLVRTAGASSSTGAAASAGGTAAALDFALAFAFGRLVAPSSSGAAASAGGAAAALHLAVPFAFGRLVSGAAASAAGDQPASTPYATGDSLGRGPTHFRGKLRELRQEAISILRELQSRWRPVDRQLRSFQSEAVHRVTARRDFGFTALLIVLQSWVDTSYPFGLVRGLPAVGFAPHYGVFPQQPADMISQQEVLEGLGHNHAILKTLRAGKDDEALLAQSEVDAAAGFCTPPLTQQQLQAVLQQRPYRFIPRCIIVRSSEKKRAIDNADAGGQSERLS